MTALTRRRGGGHGMDELRDAIAAELLRTGGVMARASEISGSLEEWRRPARSAASQLGRPVETVATETRAWVALTDWPSNAEKQAVHDAAMRAELNSVNLPLLSGAQEDQRA